MNTTSLILIAQAVTAPPLSNPLNIWPYLVLAIVVFLFVIQRKRLDQKKLQSSQVSSQTSSGSTNGGLDFRKLAGFIIFLGLLLVGYGVFQRTTNQPMDYPQGTAKSNQSLLNALDNSVRDTDAKMAVDQKNLERQEIREKSTKFMIAGGIVIFLGFAVTASIKK